MNRIIPIILMFAGPALAVDYCTVNVGTSATNVTSCLTGGPYKSVMVENGGANAIYCSRNPSVTTDDGHKVAANDGWRSFPFDDPNLYCDAATAAQDGTGRNKTIIWGSYQ